MLKHPTSHGRPDALAVTLESTASIARKCGHLDAADAALGRVRRLVSAAAASDTAGGAAAVSGGGASGGWWRSMARPESPWLLETVKLMWDRGQAAAALRELHSLIASVEAALPAGSPGTGGRGGSPGAAAGAGSPHAHLARMLSLAGKWSAATQHGGGRTGLVMALMTRGADTLLDGGGGRGRLACQVFFRLAAFADERYK